ncbi:N-acetyl-alpha-D-glucosaminyl L-malate synthase [compost metagenome]
MFCLTSRAEGVPIAVFEAGAIGLPVVSTNVGSLREVIEDGVSGYLVDRAGDTAGAIAARLGQLAEQPALRQHLGAQLQKRVLNDFSAAAIARIHADAYETALRR